MARMSTADAHVDEYSMSDEQDELRAEFDDQFDWDEDDTYQVDSCWCSTGSADFCCV